MSFIGLHPRGKGEGGICCIFAVRTFYYTTTTASALPFVLRTTYPSPPVSLSFSFFLFVSSLSLSFFFVSVFLIFLNVYKPFFHLVLFFSVSWCISFFSVRYIQFSLIGGCVSVFLCSRSPIFEYKLQ